MVETNDMSNIERIAYLKALEAEKEKIFQYYQRLGKVDSKVAQYHHSIVEGNNYPGYETIMISFAEQFRELFESEDAIAEKLQQLVEMVKGFKNSKCETYLCSWWWYFWRDPKYNTKTYCQHCKDHVKTFLNKICDEILRAKEIIRTVQLSCDSQTFSDIASRAQQLLALSHFRMFLIIEPVESDLRRAVDEVGIIKLFNSINPHVFGKKFATSRQIFKWIKKYIKLKVGNSIHQFSIGPVSNGKRYIAFPKFAETIKDPNYAHSILDNFEYKDIKDLPICASPIEHRAKSDDYRLSLKQILEMVFNNKKPHIPRQFEIYPEKDKSGKMILTLAYVYRIN